MDNEAHFRAEPVGIMGTKSDHVDIPGTVRESARSIDRLALDLLESDEPFSAESVHQIRVATKRLRAHWNLVRPDLDKKAYRRAKERLRISARCLAGQRDARVILSTLETLFENARSAKLRRSAKAVHETANAYFRAGAAEPTGSGKKREMVDALQSDREEWSELDLGGADARLLEHGLRTTYAKARRHGRRAARSRQPEAFHRWRRWSKYLLYQLEALEHLDPERLRPWLRDLKRIGKLLGKSQDYTIAMRLVRDTLDLQEQDRRRVIDALEEKQRAVLRKVCASRNRVFELRPDQFVRALTEDMGLKRGVRL
jgi:CHAD domain-containing protein